MKITTPHLKNFLAFSSLIFCLISCKSINSSDNSLSSDLKNQDNQNKNAVVATYSNGNITTKDLSDELNILISKSNDKNIKNLNVNNITSQQKEAIIKEIILKEVSYKEAKKRNLHKEKDYQKTLKAFESDLLKQNLLISIAKEAVEEKNLKKTYDEMVEKLKNKKDFRISFISLKNENEAEEIHRDLIKSPNLFSSLAKKKSLDKKTAKKGGDLGFINEESLPADILRKVKSLQKNQVSKPFEVGDKWIIVKFVDERPAEIITFDKAKDSLSKSIAKNAIDNFIQKTLEEAKISILVK